MCTSLELVACLPVSLPTISIREQQDELVVQGPIATWTRALEHVSNLFWLFKGTSKGNHTFVADSCSKPFQPLWLSLIWPKLVGSQSFHLAMRFPRLLLLEPSKVAVSMDTTSKFVKL